MRFLYHGTPIEYKDSILSNGLEPHHSWDSGLAESELPVVSLTKSGKRAILEAYIVDTSKVEDGEKERPAQGYVALRINAQCYEVRRWQVDEWWIMETIRPEDLKVVMEEDFASVERMYKHMQKEK